MIKIYRYNAVLQSIIDAKLTPEPFMRCGILESGAYAIWVWDNRECLSTGKTNPAAYTKKFAGVPIARDSHEPLTKWKGGDAKTEVIEEINEIFKGAANKGPKANKDNAKFFGAILSRDGIPVFTVFGFTKDEVLNQLNALNERYDNDKAWKDKVVYSGRDYDKSFKDTFLPKPMSEYANTVKLWNANRNETIQRNKRYR